MEKKKREIWPIGIAAAMATFIGGIVLAVSIMVKSDVALVSEDYYAQEIGYEAHINKERRMVADGRKPNLVYAAAAKTLELTIPANDSTRLTEGRVTFFRPSDPTKDFKVTLALDATGRMQVDLSKVMSGLWQVQVDWQEGADAYYYEERITL
jgi:nitrogen fixation protein FixH